MTCSGKNIFYGRHSRYVSLHGHFALFGSLSITEFVEGQSDHLVIINSVKCGIISLMFFRWRLQKAFFTPQSVGSQGCRGISCKDFFPIFSCFPCCRTEHDPKTHPLKMSDLKDITPEYISNAAMDYWSLNSSSQSAPPFAVLSMSPRKIQRIDQPPEQTLLDPKNVDQVDAMVTSAAVMAISPEQNEPFRDLQIMLGLVLRKGFKPTLNQESSSCEGSSSCDFSWVGWDEIFFIKLRERHFRRTREDACRSRTGGERFTNFISRN